MHQSTTSYYVPLLILQNVEVHGKDPKKVVGLTVTLQEVNLFTTGLFGCEASAEESFHTALVRKQMTVLGKISTVLHSSFFIFFPADVMLKRR